MGLRNQVTGLWLYCFSRSTRLSLDSTYLKPQRWGVWGGAWCCEGPT
jgi:hypothetical protein